jgi:hypothetical protein
MAFERLGKLADFILSHKDHDGFEYMMDWLGRRVLKFNCYERFSRKAKTFLPLSTCCSIGMLVLS